MCKWHIINIKLAVSQRVSTTEQVWMWWLLKSWSWRLKHALYHIFIYIYIYILCAAHNLHLMLAFSCREMKSKGGGYPWSYLGHLCHLLCMPRLTKFKHYSVIFHFPTTVSTTSLHVLYSCHWHGKNQLDDWLRSRRHLSTNKMMCCDRLDRSICSWQVSFTQVCNSWIKKES